MVQQHHHESSVWLRLLPTCPAFRLSDEEFAMAARLCLGTAIFDHDADSATHCFCGRHVDSDAAGTHSLTCQTVNDRIVSRHNRQSCVWRIVHRRAGISTTWEPNVRHLVTTRGIAQSAAATQPNAAPSAAAPPFQTTQRLIRPRQMEPLSDLRRSKVDAAPPCGAPVPSAPASLNAETSWHSCLAARK